MTAWRIVRSVYADDPLTGAGAARWGSRWNSVGVSMAYVSTSRALAVLEMLVHMGRRDSPPDVALMPLEIPDDLVSGMPDLPEGWNCFPYRIEPQQIGDSWVKQRLSVAMLVPSVILPAERNILINPEHPDFGQIRIGEPEPHAFDRRLFRLR